MIKHHPSSLCVPPSIPLSLSLSSPPGQSRVYVLSVSPEVSVIPGGTASFGFQNRGMIPAFQLPPNTPLNWSLTLSWTPLLTHSLYLPSNLGPVPAQGCPVRRGRAGPAQWWGGGPGAAGSPGPETLQIPGNPRSARTVNSGQCDELLICLIT